MPPSRTRKAKPKKRVKRKMRVMMYWDRGPWMDRTWRNIPWNN